MTISVPDSAKTLINEQSTKAGYSSPGEYLLSLVERDRNRGLREEIESKLAEALQSPFSAMTPQDWTDIRQEGQRLIRQEKAR